MSRHAYRRLVCHIEEKSPSAACRLLGTLTRKLITRVQRHCAQAFWHGNSADVIRTIPASAIRFYTFALYKTQLARVNPDLPPAAVSLLAGGFAGAMGPVLCNPHVRLLPCSAQVELARARTSQLPRGSLRCSA